MTALPNEVSIVEVGPRDGLQNELQKIALKDKVALIEGLSETGLQPVSYTHLTLPTIYSV